VFRGEPPLRPQHAPQRLHERREHGVHPLQRQQLADQLRLQAHVLATDRNSKILALAARNAPPDVKFAVADARRLPFADDSFDVATCSLVLHHLEPDDAVRVLKEMRRVARRGVIVNDLVRSWVGYLGALVAPRAMSKNPLFRHDAPLSVRRAYTKGEMATLAARAGLGAVRFRGLPGYRLTMAA
jgi:ubiquinone/menaquinone biosynthesis C-methylase UbiE